MKLNAERVDIQIRGKQIVKGFTLEVPEGMCTAILGPNGSGKSTFLKAIYRIQPISAGAVYLDGREIDKIPRRRMAQDVSVVSQFNQIQFEYSVYDVVLMGRTPHLGLMQRESPQDHRLAEEALRTVGMYGYKDQNFQTLSGGEKQRVVLARALTQQPKLLILDEPTNHLDIRYQLEILSIIRNLGVSVLTALHDLNLALQFCDYIYLVKEGEIYCQGEPSQVLTPENIKQVYGIGCDIFPSPINGQMMIQYHLPDRQAKRDPPADKRDIASLEKQTAVS